MLRFLLALALAAPALPAPVRLILVGDSTSAPSPAGATHGARR
jgi:hypothetical protein